MQTHKVLFALMFTVLIALVVACGSSAPVASPTTPVTVSTPAQPTAVATTSTASQPTSVPTSGSASPLETVTLAYGAPIPFMGILPVDLAIALDLFKQESLDVRMTRMPRLTANGNLLLSQVDFAAEGFNPSDIQTANRAARSVVSLARLPGASLVVRSDKKDKIRAVADLKGEKIAYGGNPGIFPYLITKAGLKADDVTFVEGGNIAEIANSLRRGNWVAAILFEPYTTELVKSGKAYSLIDLVNDTEAAKWLGGEYPGASLMTTTDTLQQRRPTVQKMANAMVKALRFMATHSAAEITAILPDEVTGKDKSLYIDALQRSLQIFSKEGMVTEASVQNAIEINKALGSIKPDAPITASALYTNEFIQNVK